MVLKNQNWTTFGLVALTLPLALPRDRLIKHGWTFKLMDFFYKVSFSPATGYYKKKNRTYKGNKVVDSEAIRGNLSLWLPIFQALKVDNLWALYRLCISTLISYIARFCFSVTTQKTRFRQKQMKGNLNSSNRKKLLERSRKKQMKEKLKSSNRKKLLGRSRKTRPRKIVSKTRSSPWEGKCCRELRCE